MNKQENSGPQVPGSVPRAAALQAVRQMAMFLDLQGRILYLNAALHGLQPAEVAGSPVFEHLAEDCRRELQEAMDSIRRGERSQVLRLGILTPEAGCTWWKARISPVKRSGDLEEFLLTASRLENTVDQPEAFEKQTLVPQALRELLERVAETFPEGLALIRRDGRYLYMNERFTDLLGYTLQDLPSGRHWFKLAFPEPRERRQALEAWKKDLKAVDEQGSSSRTMAVHCKDGHRKRIFFRLSSSAEGHFVVLADDADNLEQQDRRRRLDEQLAGAGRLADTLTHELNNLLMIIQGRVSLLLDNLDPVHPHYKPLQAIEQTVRQGSTLTGKLRRLSGGGRLERREVDLKGLLERTLGIFAAQRGELRLAARLDPPPLVVKADLLWLEQLLLMLYSYAWPEGSSGAFEVHAEPIFADPEQARTLGLGAEGPYVRISACFAETADAPSQRPDFGPPFPWKMTPSGPADWSLAAALRELRALGGNLETEGRGGGDAIFSLFLPQADAPSSDALETAPLEQAAQSSGYDTEGETSNM